MVLIPQNRGTNPTPLTVRELFSTAIAFFALKPAVELSQWGKPQPSVPSIKPQLGPPNPWMGVFLFAAGAYEIYRDLSTPRPLQGIHRFAPRAIVDDVDATRTPTLPASTVDLPGDPTRSATTAADVNPLAGLATVLKDWDGVAPLEVAGFRFEKIANADGKSTIKITISTDNVQDIIDAARAIQEAFPKDTHVIATEINAPNFRRNMLIWAHRYFGDAIAKIKAGKDRILAINRKLTNGGMLSEDDRQFLNQLQETVTSIVRGHHSAFNQSMAFIAFIIYKTPASLEMWKSWEALKHDIYRRIMALRVFDSFIETLKSGRTLKGANLRSLDNIYDSSLISIISHVATLVQVDLLGNAVEIRIEGDISEFAIEGDDHADTLIDILANLISNAARYSDPKKENREIHITVRRTNDGLEIEVRDNGIGIPADKLADIGQFGFRVGEKPVDGSHGHGLWQTQKNLDDLGWGKLHVDSTHGVGSRFWFTIPLSDIQ